MGWALVYISSGFTPMPDSQDLQLSIDRSNPLEWVSEVARNSFAGGITTKPLYPSRINQSFIQSFLSIPYEPGRSFHSDSASARAWATVFSWSIAACKFS